MNRPNQRGADRLGLRARVRADEVAALVARVTKADRFVVEDLA